MASARDLVRRTRRTLARREFPVVPAHIARLDFEQAPILVGVTSRTEILSRLRPCSKEPWTVRWLEEQLRAGDVLYDVGANIGAYALIAAALHDDVQVVALEPGYANYSALCDNIALNELHDRVVALPVALAERTELQTLHYSDPAPGAAELEVAPTESTHRRPVLAFRLDDLLEQFALRAPTLAKLDVDGAEGGVLRGATRTLERSGLRSLLVEMRRDRVEDVVGVLEHAGFSVLRWIEERDGAPLRYVSYGIFERRG
jgi:FkbM family methyltransferase